MDLIADTNVWYDSATGRRTPRVLKSAENRLFATPTNLMEIASLVNTRNLTDRAKAAQAVLDHADGILEDCE